jgi:hypothetical protein
MIRRLFWLSLGAVLGVTGYRRAVAVGRLLRPGRGGGVAAFAADVREGMALYMDRHYGQAPSTLEGHRQPGLAGGRSALSATEPKDGR